MPVIRIEPYSGDVRQFLEAVEIPFGWTPNPADWDAVTPLVEQERLMAALDGDRIVGTAGAFSMQLSVPGGELPMAGVTMVGVHPTHRRHGILRDMMRRQLNEVHERGEPLAGLWASEGAIYQRFGYGWGTRGASFEIERRRSAYRTPHEPSGTYRLIGVEEATTAFPLVFDADRASRAGSFARSADWWRGEFFYDPEHHRRGGSAAQWLLYEVDGQPAGYARYRLHPEWDTKGPKSILDVTEAIGVNPEANLSLWRYLLDVDLVSTIRGRNLPVDHPLPLILAEPRRLGWTVNDALWLRLVDLAAALQGRRWRGSDELVIEVADSFCDWNAGRWRLTVDDGQATCSRTEATADLALDASDLAAVYLGGWRVTALGLAGRAAELSAGAARRLDALLAVDAAPWCPWVF